jgi:tRNA(Arg) A34 adenosine deaminase TadA
MLSTTLTLSLPPWVNEVDLPDPQAHLSDRMEFVLALAMRNVDQGTGGPFGAAVFEQESGRLVSVGVNRVVPENSSLAHAEVLAIGLAQASLGTYDLGGSGQPRLQLVSSSQMCAMCLGAVVWSGVGEVVYSTTAGDVIATVGFDEGPTPPDYSHQLAHRGISVVAGIMRDEGLTVLRRYVASGGVVYNAHH